MFTAYDKARKEYYRLLEKGSWFRINQPYCFARIITTKWFFYLPLNREYAPLGFKEGEPYTFEDIRWQFVRLSKPISEYKNGNSSFFYGDDRRLHLYSHDNLSLLDYGKRSIGLYSKFLSASDQTDKRLVEFANELETCTKPSVDWAIDDRLVVRTNQDQRDWCAENCAKPPAHWNGYTTFLDEEDFLLFTIRFGSS